LDVRREGCGGLAQLEAEVVEIAFRRRMGAEFVDDRSEVGRGADRGELGCIGPVYTQVGKGTTANVV